MTEWYDRFERDAAFRQAAVDAYDGRHEVGDAVWWVDHPELAAPSGAPSPLAPLAALQRAAFGRPGAADAAARPAAADTAAAAGGAAGRGRGIAHLQELAAFRAMLEADRSETLAALEEAQAVLDARPAQRRRVGLLVGGLAAAVCVAGVLAFGAVALFAPGGAAGAFPLFGTAGDSGAADNDSGAADGSDTGADSVPITGDAPPGAGSFGGDGSSAQGSGDGSSSQGSADDGGSSYGATLNDPAAVVPAPALTADPYPNIPAADRGDSYATVFSRAQSASDLPPFALPEGLIGETFRALSVAQNTPGAAYAAISDERMVCLVVYGNPLEYAYTCDTAAVVGTSGLQSSISTRDRLDSATGDVLPAIALSARWRADGDFTLDRSTPYDRD